MTPDMQISVALVASIAAIVGVIYNIVVGQKKNTKEEVSGIMKANLKLDELCNTSRETRLDIQKLDSKIDQIKEKQIEHELRLQNVEKKVEDL